MNIKCKIVDIHPESHSITVRYFSDKISEDDLSTVLNADGSVVRRSDGTPLRCKTDSHISLPFPAPAGDELLGYIFKTAPPNRSIFEIEEEKKKSPGVDSLAHVKEMLNLRQEFEVPEEVGEGRSLRRKIFKRSDANELDVSIEEV